MDEDDIPPWALYEARKAAGIDVGNIDSVPLALSMRAHARTLVELSKHKTQLVDEDTLDARELFATWCDVSFAKKIMNGEHDERPDFIAFRDKLRAIKARERGEL